MTQTQHKTNKLQRAEPLSTCLPVYGTQRLLLLLLLCGLNTLKSFTIGLWRITSVGVTCHCRKARVYTADLSLCLNVPVVTVRSEMTDWGRLFHTVGEAWQKMMKDWFFLGFYFLLMSESVHGGFIKQKYVSHSDTGSFIWQLENARNP